MSRAASGWQSVPGDDLTRRERATIRANWQELCEYLAAPGVAWSWGESGLSERLKHYLRHHSLIVRDSDNDSKWQTTEKLWVAVLEDAADDETVGASSTGQCKLPVEARASTPTRRQRSGVHTSAGSGVEAVQATLAGGTVDPVNDGGEVASDTTLVAVNLSKGERDDPEEPGDGQSPLTRWTGIDTVTLPDGAVAGATPDSDAVRVAQAGQDDAQATLATWGVRVDTSIGDWDVTVDADGRRLRRIDA